jgi:RNA 3'-terminal phosphate cyclase-like protein
MDPTMKLQGSENLRIRLILSILSSKPVSIINIRSQDENPGLRDYEISMVRFLVSMCDGVSVKFDQTGTALKFKPGMLMGGEINHTVPNSRSVVYILETASILAPFCKNPLKLRLKGVTHNDLEISTDIFKSVTIPFLKKIFPVNSPSLDIVNKSGEVYFSCPVVEYIQPVVMKESLGLVKRVRGVCWSAGVSTQFNQKIIETVRRELNPCLQDIWIFADNLKGLLKDVPSVGLSLVAETEYGGFIGASGMKQLDENVDVVLEEMAENVSLRLLWEIDNAGCVDSCHQWMLAMFMAVSGDFKVSKAIFGGQLVDYTISVLQEIRNFLGVKFRVSSETVDFKGIEETKQSMIVLECIGINLKNVARKTF